MELREKLALLEEMMEMEAGSLEPEMALESLENWDSIASLNFLAMLEEQFSNASVSGTALRQMKTVSDLLAAMTSG